jgi:hypothetical protein
VSLLYFHSSARRDFSTLLYTIVCGVDVCTCVVHLPVMIALYNNRKPGIFGEDLFCVPWILVFSYLQKMSMFLVMLLSVSRTVTLFYLRYKIKKKLLIAAFLSYTAFMLLWRILTFVFGRSTQWFGYFEFDVYCYADQKVKPLSYINQLIISICIGIPPIITTISFTMFSYKLLRRNHVSKMNKRKQQAAVTMAMFTALFLTCNLPCLANNVTWFVNKLLYGTYPGPIYQHPFLAYYSWLISDIISTVLNATLNPILYFLRIESLRLWVRARGASGSINRASEII